MRFAHNYFSMFYLARPAWWASLLLGLFGLISTVEAATPVVSSLKVAPRATDGAAVVSMILLGASQVNVDRRSDDGMAMSCPSPNILLADGWCRAPAVGVERLSGASLMVRSWVDPNVVLDWQAPREYQYRVSVVDASGNTLSVPKPVTAWAANAPSAPADPVAAWLTKVNEYLGLQSDPIQAAQIPVVVADEQGNAVSQFVQLNRGGRDWYVLANDKYLALFNDRGTLESLSHRLYGMHFMRRAGSLDEPHYPFAIRRSDGNVWAVSQAKVSPEFDGSGVLSFHYAEMRMPDGSAMAGGQALTRWWLSSRGRKGLHARMELVGVPNLDSVGFPLLSGLGDVNFDPDNASAETSGLLLPRENSGDYFARYPVQITRYFSGRQLHNAETSGLLHQSSWGLQFFAINMPYGDGQFGAGVKSWLYLAAEDPTYEPKGFVYAPYFRDPDTGGRTLSWSYLRLFPQAADGGRADGVAPNYDVVLTPMVADSWVPVARHYRAWAQGAPAGKLSDLTLGKRISNDLKRGLFWWTSWGAEGEDATVQSMIDAANARKAIVGPASTGVKVALHQYQWYQDRFDINVGRYSPVQWGGRDPVSGELQPLDEGFAFKLKRDAGGKPDGTLVVPYLNAANVDMSNSPILAEVGSCIFSSSPAGDRPFTGDGYGENHGFWGRLFPSTDVAADDYLIHRPDGRLPATCASYTRAALAFPDPTTDFWRGVMSDTLGTMLLHGADGVYLDSLGAGYQPDYSGAQASLPPRRHGQGHGSWWLSGFNEILAMAKQYAAAVELLGYEQRTLPSGARRLVAAEFFNEGMLPGVDVIADYSPPQSSNAPVIQSVFGDRVIFAGQALASQADGDEIARAMLAGRSFAWGNQLGLASSLCGSSNFTCAGSELPRYVSRLTVAHRAWAYHLQFGQFLAVLDGAKLHASGVACFFGRNEQCQALTQPVVRGGYWRGGAGGEALILTNTSGSAVTDTFALPLRWRNLSAVSVCSPTEECSSQSLTPGSTEISLSVPAFDAVIVRPK